MASTPAQAAGRADPTIAHLPDASEELGRTADLTISVKGTQLKLHSVVATAGSRVLRTALCSCGGADGSSAATAVQLAFEGSKLADVQLFLKLLYSPLALEGRLEKAGEQACTLPASAEPAAWQGILELADKLDAPGVLQACELCILGVLSGTRIHVDWLSWLMLADKLRLGRVAACCIQPVLEDLLCGLYTGRGRMAQLTQLGQPAAGMLLAVLVQGMHGSDPYNKDTLCATVAGRLPAGVDYRAPENLF